jgi:6-pyruvoyl-tetrahydropterin synthase
MATKFIPLFDLSQVIANAYLENFDKQFRNDANNNNIRDTLVTTLCRVSNIIYPSLPIMYHEDEDENIPPTHIKAETEKIISVVDTGFSYVKFTSVIPIKCIVNPKTKFCVSHSLEFECDCGNIHNAQDGFLHIGIVNNPFFVYGFINNYSTLDNLTDMIELEAAIVFRLMNRLVELDVDSYFKSNLTKNNLMKKISLAKLFSSDQESLKYAIYPAHNKIDCKFNFVHLVYGSYWISSNCIGTAVDVPVRLINDSTYSTLRICVTFGYNDESGFDNNIQVSWKQVEKKI